MFLTFNLYLVVESMSLSQEVIDHIIDLVVWAIASRGMYESSLLFPHSMEDMQYANNDTVLTHETSFGCG